MSDKTEVTLVLKRTIWDNDGKLSDTKWATVKVIVPQYIGGDVFENYEVVGFSTTNESASENNNE